MTAFLYLSRINNCMKGLQKFSVVCLLLTVLQAKAQTDTTAKPLEEVIVTANRTKTPEATAGYATSVISKKQLEQFAPRTTPEALMGLNGVFLQKTNHGGGSAFVRGLTGNQTLILIDGIRLNNATFRYGPNQYLNSIDPFNIEQIEVLRGAGSVQYGSDAIGGVVHVFTKDPVFQSAAAKRTGGTVLAKFMSGNMEQTARAELQYSRDKFAAIAGVTVRNFGDLIAGDTTGRQSPSGYNEMAYNIKLKFKLNNRVLLTTAQQFLIQDQVPVYHKIRLENFKVNEMDPQQRMLSYLKLSVANHNRLFKSIDLVVSHQQMQEGRNSQKNNQLISVREKDNVNSFAVTLDIASVVNSNWTARSGVDLYYDHVQSSRTTTDLQLNSSRTARGLYPNGSGYGNYSLFSLHHFQFQRLKADAGLRYNFFGIRIKDSALGNVYLQPSALVGHVALSYEMYKGHYLFTSFNSGYRAPNIDDMGTLGLVDFRYEIPAADLLPERSVNYEAGYKFRSRNFRFTSSFFYLQLKQLITREKIENEQISGYNVYKKENTGRAFIRGTETEAEILLLKNWRVNAGIAYLYGANTSDDEPLRRIPPFNGRIRTTYQRNHWFAAAECWFADKQERLARGDREDNRIPAGGTPGFTVLNLYAGYAYKQTFKINTGLQNLFNQDYRTHGSGINGYGRSIWLSLQYMF